MTLSFTFRLRVLLACFVLLGSGCSPDFEPATLISRGRVLGASVEVVGDALRANPLPLESADVRWLVVFPAEAQPVSWVFISCVPEPTMFGEPRCAGRAGDPAIQLEPALATPNLRVDVPDASRLGDADTLLVLGAICFGGEVNLDIESQAACANADDQGNLVVLQVPIDRDGMINHRPQFEAVSLNGDALDYVAADDAPASGCGGGTAPQLAWTEEPTALELSAAAGSREMYSAERGVPPTPTLLTEELQVESLSTAGEIDQRFAFFDDRNATISLEWTLPLLEDVASDGSLVRLTFTMRDGRGGFDSIARAVCVVAP